jgi:hypothetical protein
MGVITRSEVFKQFCEGLNKVFGEAYDPAVRVQRELLEANPSLQPEELQALVKLTLSAEQIKERCNE